MCLRLLTKSLQDRREARPSIKAFDDQAWPAWPQVAVTRTNVASGASHEIGQRPGDDNSGIRPVAGRLRQLVEERQVRRDLGRLSQLEFGRQVLDIHHPLVIQVEAMDWRHR